MRIVVRLSFFCSCLFFLTSCKKDKEVTPDVPAVTPITPAVPGAGSVNLSFVNMAGSDNLQLGNAYYLTQNSDSVKVDVFKYYVSNFQLVKDDGSIYTIPETYFLVDAAKTASLNQVLSNVPPGNYTSLKFIIGVDSLRNVSGAQTGALDPANGMFWTWSTGYIMAKIEGSSPQSGSPSKTVSFHIGGFSGSASAQKSVEIPFNNKITVNSNSTPRILLKADVMEWFKTPNSLELASTYLVVTIGPLSRSIAANYADMFSLIGITY